MEIQHSSKTSEPTIEIMSHSRQSYYHVNCPCKSIFFAASLTILALSSHFFHILIFAGLHTIVAESSKVLYIYPNQLWIELPENTKVIKQIVFIPAKPVQVYDAYIDAKKHSDFTGGKATCNPKVGGDFTAWDGYIFGRNLELRKGKKILQEWTTTEWPKGYPPSILELSFISKEGVLN